MVGRGILTFGLTLAGSRRSAVHGGRYGVARLTGCECCVGRRGSVTVGARATSGYAGLTDAKPRGETMAPDAEERDALFKKFGRAFFKKDLDAMYQVVTEDFAWSIQVGDQARHMTTRAQVAAFFEERQGTQKDVRFEDVVFHHAPDATFMTYRIMGTDVASGARFERVGVERYSFRDGRIAEKDVFSRVV